MLPQAPSSDTTGWFACDAETFGRVSAVMLEEKLPTALPERLIVAVDAFGFAGEAVKTALAPLLAKLSDLIGQTSDASLAPMGLSVWGRAQRSLQPYEAWLTFKDWVDTRNPRLAFNVARGLLVGSMIPEAERQWATLMRQEARARMTYLLPSGTLLAMPTTPFPAPKRRLPLAVQNPLRERLLCLCAHGGLTGVPQVSIPGATLDGAPIGLSIVGGHGTDATLVTVARALAQG
jgi:amidase